jgi:hypothetical protein
VEVAQEFQLTGTKTPIFGFWQTNKYKDCMRGSIQQNLNMLLTRHRQGVEPNVFIYSLPRSGSTWLMELILSQPGFRRFNEPLNLRKPAVRENLGMSEWIELHQAPSKDKIHRYFSRLCSGELRDARFNFRGPLAKFYRPLTWRTVFKIINGGHEHVDWLPESFNGRVVLLLRHPIPVAMSRKSFPELEAILESEFVQRLSDQELRVARSVARNGGKLAKGVLDWCLRNTVALRGRKSSWSVVTYEQLILDPRPVIDDMSRKLDLPKPERMLAGLKVPSRSFQQSTPETQQVLRSDQDKMRQRWLVEKWQSKISTEDLKQVEDVIRSFGLDRVYGGDSALPRQEFWIGHSAVPADSR